MGKGTSSTQDTGPGPALRLSLPWHRLRTRYDVVVVGSGYGGAITAARLARAGRSVCVLERGRELHAGDFPDSLVSATRQLQVHQGGRHRFGRRSGLFDLRAGHDLSVLVGCGLGGTSLINAGVALRPPDWVYADERWPRALRGAQGPAALAPYFAEAERVLGSQPYPDDWPTLPKLAALDAAAAGIGAEVRRPPINVTFTTGPNAVGVEQTACNLCGDCVTGCNHGAKNTLTANYLPDAVAHGAEVFCEAAVRTVRPAGAAEGGWIVSFAVAADGRTRFAAPSSFVFADVVVLAAGALGSTEILLRSRNEGLAVSPRLGQRFSGNGDVLAFAYDVTGAPARGIGLGRRVGTADNGVGPCITGMIDLTGQPVPGKGALIEEGAIPGALRALMPAAFAVVSDIEGGGTPLAFAGRLWRRAQASVAAALDGKAGAAERSLTYLVMGDDVGDGEVRLDGDGVRVDWPAVGDLPIFDHNADVLRSLTRAIGGNYVSDPIWSPLLHDSLVTVHPLGGCAMADDGAHGVVDDRGRVFAGEGTAVHDGLLVADGSIVPRPLAVNPLLTISALTERAVGLLAEERGWRAETAPSVATPPAATGTGRRSETAAGRATATTPAPPRPGLTFTERMAGWAGPVTTGPGHDDIDPDAVVALATAGAARGEADGTRAEFVLTIDVDDLPGLVADAATPGRLSGSVVAPVLHPRRLRVVDGSFVLCEPDPSHVDTWHMRYSIDLAADDGRRFSFDGIKVLQDRAGLDAWGDTTTLYVTLGDEEDRVVAAGMLHISPGDLARQVSTMRVRGVQGRAARARWLARFLRRFGRSLWAVYGSLDDVARFPNAPARAVPLTGAGHRRLRLPTPEPRWCDGAGRWHEGDDIGSDGWLRLTRYEGGRRGPVLLASGFGMSATSFLIDTVDTNLAEYLVKGGYDVWLLDYRTSIDLPSRSDPCSLDDIARQDWPAAVAEVRRVTGAGTVQAVGHCVGSATLMMALASGLSGVRSAVCMQFTLHPSTSYWNLAKAALKVDRALGRIGLHKVEPLTKVDVPDVVLDAGMRALPIPRAERCGKALCRWINAIYGCTHAHAQLDDATHEHLDDLFGVANLEALGHIGTVMRKRLVVDEAGEDVYTRHPERLNLPILLVQGDRNYIFHPEGSMRTLRWLQSSANEPSMYERVVLPGYAHLDALIGRHADRDVYPRLRSHLDRFNR